MSHDALIERIRKLQAKAQDRSVTEEEAMLYAAKVAQLLQQHNLDEAVLEVQDDDGITEDVWGNTWTSDTWGQTVASGVAALYFCDFYLMRNRRKQSVKIVFVGKKHNIEIAKSMTRYLINTIVRLANAYADSPTAKADWDYTWTKARNGFMRGAGARIWQRLYEMKRQVTKEQPKQDAQGHATNLPALYQNEEALVKNFMDNKDLIKPKGNTGSMSVGGGHAVEGAKAANRISLGEQLPDKSSRLLK